MKNTRWRKLKNNKNFSVSPKSLKQSKITITLAQMYAISRIKAFITDLFMIYTPILYIVTYGILGSAEEFRHSSISVFICVCLYGIISALFLSISSQTPGLRYMNLVLVKNNGEKVSFILSLVRFFLWLFGTAIFIGILVPFFRRDCLCFHDLVCKTHICLKAENKKE